MKVALCFNERDVALAILAGDAVARADALWICERCGCAHYRMLPEQPPMQECAFGCGPIDDIFPNVGNWIERGLRALHRGAP